jgi:hypothetical protein
MQDVATKTDLKSLKDEIMEHMNYRFDRVYEDMATKDDLNELQLATKVEFDRVWAVMATKKDLQELEERLTAKMATKEDMNIIINMLDAAAKRQAIYNDERLAISYQLSRYERWHQQSAEYLGIELSDN